MKKSEIYHLSQIAVVQSPQIAPESKIEILKVLWEQEKFEMYCEKQTESEATSNGKPL